MQRTAEARQIPARKDLATAHNAHQAGPKKHGQSIPSAQKQTCPALFKQRRARQESRESETGKQSAPPYRRRNDYRPSFPPILRTMVLMKAASGTLSLQAGTNVTAKATSPPAMTYARACTIEPDSGETSVCSNHSTAAPAAAPAPPSNTAVAKARATERRPNGPRVRRRYPNKHTSKTK